MILDHVPDVILVGPGPSETKDDVFKDGTGAVCSALLAKEGERHEDEAHDPEGCFRALTSMEYTSSARHAEGQSFTDVILP